MATNFFAESLRYINFDSTVQRKAIVTFYSTAQTGDSSPQFHIKFEHNKGYGDFRISFTKEQRLIMSIDEDHRVTKKHFWSRSKRCPSLTLVFIDVNNRESLHERRLTLIPNRTAKSDWTSWQRIHDILHERLNIVTWTVNARNILTTFGYSFYTITVSCEGVALFRRSSNEKVSFFSLENHEFRFHPHDKPSLLEILYIPNSSVLVNLQCESSVMDQIRLAIEERSISSSTSFISPPSHQQSSTYSSPAMSSQEFEQFQTHVSFDCQKTPPPCPGSELYSLVYLPNGYSDKGIHINPDTVEESVNDRQNATNLDVTTSHSPDERQFIVSNLEPVVYNPSNPITASTPTTIRPNINLPLNIPLPSSPEHDFELIPRMSEDATNETLNATGNISLVSESAIPNVTWRTRLSNFSSTRKKRFGVFSLSRPPVACTISRFMIDARVSTYETISPYSSTPDLPALYAESSDLQPDTNPLYQTLQRSYCSDPSMYCSIESIFTSSSNECNTDSHETLVKRRMSRISTKKWRYSFYPYDTSIESTTSVNDIRTEPTYMSTSESNGTSALCFTLQNILDRASPPNPDTLGLDWRTMTRLRFALFDSSDLIKGWQDLADNIGFTSRDIQMIAHFTYHMHVTPFDVIIWHWQDTYNKFQRHSKMPPCNQASLVHIFHAMNRADLVAIIEEFIPMPSCHPRELRRQFGIEFEIF